MKPSFNVLEKHFCDIKWSQRLKGIGIRQDTCFHWVYHKNHDVWTIEMLRNYNLDIDIESCAAFTVQDFIDLFPKLFRIARSEKEWKFYCEYADMHLQDEENLANVFARILIAITKNKDHKIMLNNLPKENIK